MFERKFNVEELYILHVSELTYYIPFDNDGIYFDDYYAQEYYTIASSKDGKTFKDIFKIAKYKSAGYVGFGLMRDIEEILPLKSYTENINGSLTRDKAAEILDSFVEELNELAETRDEQPKVLEGKKLELLV